MGASAKVSDENVLLSIIDELREAILMCEQVFGNQLGWEQVVKEHPIIREVTETQCPPKQQRR